MTTVDSAVICDLAYFDRFKRLCMFGVETTGPVRTLRTGTHRFSIVIRLRHRDPGDEPDVAVFLTSPDGEWRAADGYGEYCVENCGEYLLVHMPSVSLESEGIYRLEIACGTQEPATCEFHILASLRPPTGTYAHGTH